jgi:hypothetical protein
VYNTSHNIRIAHNFAGDVAHSDASVVAAFEVYWKGTQGGSGSAAALVAVTSRLKVIHLIEVLARGMELGAETKSRGLKRKGGFGLFAALPSEQT